MSRNAETRTTFYSEAADAEEVYTGYLYKSPPSGLMKKMNSWKRRYFVLAKTSDSTHELRYYRNPEKDTAIKSIDVSTITTLLNTCPKEHPVLDWICRNFKCSPSSVLFMKAKDPKDKAQRDYFFIGENSEVVDGWFNALLWVQKFFPHHNKTESEPKQQNMTELNSDQQTRSMSPPLTPNMIEPKSDHISHDTEQRDCAPPLPPKKRMSAPDGFKIQHDECDESSSPSTLKVKLDESARDSSEDTGLSLGRESAASNEESLLDSVTKVFNDLKTQKISNEDKKTQSERNTSVEKEICICLDDLNGLIFTEETGKPCVSECRQIESTCQLHKGDQILAVNDLLTETVEDIQTYLRKINKHEVKLTILRHADSISLHPEHTPCKEDKNEMT